MKTKLFISTLALSLVTSVHAAVAKPMTFLMDAQTIAWLEDMAHPLLKAAELPISETNIYLIKNNEVNAFVTAKNDIFVYTGLILRAESAEEVQGVLAHEIAHIKARHVTRTLSRQKELSVPTIVGAVLGVGAAALGNPNAANALIISGGAASQSNFLKYSREHERQADQIGATLLNQNQYSAEGMLTFFEKLRGDQLLYSTTPPAYLLTHPLPSERLAAVKNHIKTQESNVEKLKFGNADEFLTIQAKLKAFTEDGSRVRRLYAFDESKQGRLANILVMALEGKIREALIKLDESPETYNPFYHELKAQLLLDLSKFNEALDEMRKAVELRPTSSLLRIQYANILTLTQNYEEAIAELVKLRLKHMTWTSIHRDLAIAYGRLGQLTASHLSLAEEAYLKKNSEDLRTHLEIAEKHLKDATPDTQKRYTRIKDELLSRSQELE